mmetsp:Transcript_40689/g.103442  ORF Transcript_40689/g.103442 Transcript_40689/m.103442 type:complete len:202 (-) Transcript_40689:2-607(-)
MHLRFGFHVVALLLPLRGLAAHAPAALPEEPPAAVHVGAGLVDRVALVVGARVLRLMEHDERLSLEVLGLKDTLFHVQLDLLDLAVLPEELPQREVQSFVAAVEVLRQIRHEDRARRRVPHGPTHGARIDELAAPWCLLADERRGPSAAFAIGRHLRSSLERLAPEPGGRSAHIAGALARGAVRERKRCPGRACASQSPRP